MPEVLVSIAHEGLAVMTIYFGLFLWYFDEAVLRKLPFEAGFGWSGHNDGRCLRGARAQAAGRWAMLAQISSVAPCRSTHGRPLPRRARLEQRPTAWRAKWIVVRGLRSSRLLRKRWHPSRLDGRTGIQLSGEVVLRLRWPSATVPLEAHHLARHDSQYSSKHYATISQSLILVPLPRSLAMHRHGPRRISHANAVRGQRSLLAMVQLFADRLQADRHPITNPP